MKRLDRQWKWMLAVGGLLVLGGLLLLISGCAATAASPEQTYAILGRVVVSADLVRGSKNPISAVCADTSQFGRGEEVVPRVKILDPKTDKYLTDKEVKSANFVLKDGTSVPMHYGPHPAPPKQATDAFWTAGWTVPDSYPTGATGWWIEVQTNDGRSGRYDPPKVDASALTIFDRTAKK